MPTWFKFLSNSAKPTIQWTDKVASVVDKRKPLLGSRDDSGIFQSTRTPSGELTGEIQLSTRSSQEVDVSLRLEGPYFTLSDPSRYKTVVCLVAGTGVSGAIAIARAFIEQKRRRMTALEIGSELGASERPANTSIWERCVILWSVRSEAYIDLPYLHGKQSISMTHSIEYTLILTLFSGPDYLP